MGTFWIYSQCFQERSQASSYYSMFHHDPLSSLSSSYGRSCGVASQSGTMGMVSSSSRSSHLISCVTFSPNQSGSMGMVRTSHVSFGSSHLIFSRNWSLHPKNLIFHHLLNSHHHPQHHCFIIIKHFENLKPLRRAPMAVPFPHPLLEAEARPPRDF